MNFSPPSLKTPPPPLPPLFPPPDAIAGAGGFVNIIIGCGATNACVSLKKESGVIRSDIFSREYARTSPPFCDTAKIWPFLNGCKKLPLFPL